MSNGLDPDQDRHFVGPGLGSNCLQRLLYQQVTKVDASSHQEQRETYLVEISAVKLAMVIHLKRLLYTHISLNYWPAYLTHACFRMFHYDGNN